MNYAVDWSPTELSTTSVDYPDFNSLPVHRGDIKGRRFMCCEAKIDGELWVASEWMCEGSPLYYLKRVLRHAIKRRYLHIRDGKPLNDGSDGED